MKLAFTLALALLLPLAVAAQEAPDDRYIAIYDTIQQADAFSDANKVKEAQAKYADAQAALLQFQKEFPDWNVKIVSFRLNYLASKTKTPLPKPVAEAIRTNNVVGELPATPADAALVKQLQADLQTAQAGKAALEQKLQTALAAQTASSNSLQSLTDAQEKIRALTDENQIMKRTLRLQQLDSVPAVDKAALEQLTKDLAEARRKLEENSQTITTLGTEKQSLQSQLAKASEANAKAALNSNVPAAITEQIKLLEAEKTDLQARLKIAEAKTAGADAAQLAAAEEKLRQLQKENSLLRAGLESKQTESIQLTNNVLLVQQRQELAAVTEKLQKQTELVANYALEKTAMQKQLEAARQTAEELERAKHDLTSLKRKYQIQTEAAIILISEANLKIARQNRVNNALTKDNQQLKKQLGSLASSTRFVVDGLRAENDSLNKQLAKKRTAPSTDESRQAMEQLETQLAKLRAKLNVLEAAPIPFTTEELALFRRPATATLALTDDKKTRAKLPTGSADLIREAQQLYADRKYDDARAKYLSVLELDPRNVYTLGNLATIELELNQTTEAEQHLQSAIAINPKDAYSLGVLGNLRFRQGKFDQALDALSHAAELNPKDAEIQNFLGVTLSQKGQRAAAEAALRRAIQLDPEYGGAHNNLAVIYLSQTPPQVELARWHYQKARAAGQSQNPDLEALIEKAAQAPEAAKP